LMARLGAAQAELHRLGVPEPPESAARQFSYSAQVSCQERSALQPYAGQLSASGLVKSTHSISIPSQRASSSRAIEDDDHGIQATSHSGQCIWLPLRQVPGSPQLQHSSGSASCRLLLICLCHLRTRARHRLDPRESPQRSRASEPGPPACTPGRRAPRAAPVRLAGACHARARKSTPRIWAMSWSTMSSATSSCPPASPHSVASPGGRRLADGTTVLAELPRWIVSGACTTPASSSVANKTVATPAAPQLSPRPSLTGPAGARPATASRALWPSPQATPPACRSSAGPAQIT